MGLNMKNQNQNQIMWAVVRLPYAFLIAAGDSDYSSKVGTTEYGVQRAWSYFRLSTEQEDLL